MSVDSIQSVAGWEGVSSALQEIRDCHAETWAFFHGIFEELNLFSISLDAHKRHLVQTISTEEAKQQAESADFSDRLSQLLSQTEADRDEIRETRATVQEQVAHLAAVAAELANAQLAFQANFELIREELAKNREAFAQDAAAVTVAVSADASSELEQKLTDLEREHAALEQDRAVLEKELEGVRNRAADLAESLAEQKRLAAQQQSQGNAELQRMRQLLESIAKQNHESEPAAASVAPAAAVSKLEAPAASADPVLGSVLAQFEMLQQDRARRRA